MVDWHWKVFGKVEIISAENGLFVFKFEKDDFCDLVLEQMWHVNHRPLLLRRWDPNAQFINFSWDKVPIWVKLRNVPCSLITRRGLSYIASTLGMPLQMDKLTESRTFVGFARVCIEMDLSKELPNHTFVKLRNGDWARIEVEYAWKPLVCSSCKIVGHALSSCPNATRQNVARQGPQIEKKKDGDWKSFKTKKIWKRSEYVNPTPFANVIVNPIKEEICKVAMVPPAPTQPNGNRFSVLDVDSAHTENQNEVQDLHENVVSPNDEDLALGRVDGDEGNLAAFVQDGIGLASQVLSGHIVDVGLSLPPSAVDPHPPTT